MVSVRRVALTRRFAAAVAFAALIIAASTLAPAARSATTTPTASTKLVKRVPAPGAYAVVVSIAAPPTDESVSVFVGSRSALNVPLTPGAGITLAFDVRVHSRRLTVRTVSTGAKAGVTITTSRQPAQSTLPRVVSYGASGSPTGPTGATGATGSTGATIVSPPTGPYKRLVWSDEFNGPAGTAPNPANWSDDSYGGCGDNTLSTNTQSTANAALDGNGNLAITADGGPSYDSAQIDSANHFSFEYGELEARIRLPSNGSGLCSAFWLLGDPTPPGSAPPGACWPQCGEIDVMEAISPYPNSIFATLHGPVSGSSNFQSWEATLASTTAFTGTFHTYGVIWRPGSITWTFDGAPYATATPSTLPASAQWVFDGHPFHIVLDLAVGGWPGPPAAGAPFPATLDVDWVRLYN
jgi:beta-glucanase (GH16 family)